MRQKLIDRQVVYEGTKVRLEIHHLENEETGKRHRREVCAHPGAVVVMGFLPDERVVLIRNYRYAVGAALLELPAGTLEKNEDPMNCAGRELLEETGYLATRLSPLLTFYTSPGILGEKMYAFAAYDLHQAEAAPEEGEEIEVLPVTWAEAMDMLKNREIQDAKTIATLLTYDRFYREQKH